MNGTDVVEQATRCHHCEVIVSDRYPGVVAVGRLVFHPQCWSAFVYGVCRDAGVSDA